MLLILSLSKDAPVLVQDAYVLSRSEAARQAMRLRRSRRHRMDCHAASGGSQ
jgi:hypothetical protein